MMEHSPAYSFKQTHYVETTSEGRQCNNVITLFDVYTRLFRSAGAKVLCKFSVPGRATGFR